MTATSVDKILKNHNSRHLTVPGYIKCLGEPLKPEHGTKMLSDDELTDPSGTTQLSVWYSQIQQIQGKLLYNATNSKLKHYFGKCLATTVNNAVTKAKAQAISNVEQSQNKQNWLCCPEIMHIYLTMYPESNSNDCCKKICENSGSNIVHCLHCNRAMLLKKCHTEMNITFYPEKQKQHLHDSISQNLGHLATQRQYKEYRISLLA